MDDVAALLEIEAIEQLKLTREAFWSCPDGRQLANAISYSFDAVTLTGTSSGNVPVGCEGFPIVIDGITVTLTRV